MTRHQILQEIERLSREASNLDPATDFDAILRHMVNVGKIAGAALQGEDFRVEYHNGVAMILRTDEVTLLGTRATKLRVVS